MYRARQLALGGAELFFDDSTRRSRGETGCWRSTSPHEADVMPAGSGMILIPAVFDWLASQ